MKPIVLVVLVACTSTRQLAAVDPRLRIQDHPTGFVVRTTERWNERVDPNTVLRFKSASGAWSDRLSGRDLYVDHEGAWIERTVVMWQVTDAVRIEGMAPDAAEEILATRPDAAVLERDGEAWILRASRDDLKQWLLALELAVARLEPVTTLGVLEGDDAKLYSLRVLKSSAPLGTWSVASNGGWLPAIRGPGLTDFLNYGRTMKVGWRWDQVAAVEVENISGGKTLGGIAGTAVVAVALLPFALVLRGGSLVPGHPGGRGGDGGGTVPGFGGGGGGVHAPGGWTPDLAPPASLDARPLFSTGSRVRSYVLPTLSLDGAAATRGDLIASGVIARVRFADLFEIGGGVRIAETRAMTPAAGWSRSTTGVFQFGLHLPLDAGFRFAIPLGFEVGGGGDVRIDLRFPWGLRYTAGRWFATATPASPSYLHLRDEPHGRWSLTSGLEVGTSF